MTSPDWHDELVLITELVSVNTQIGRFVLRALDADAGMASRISAEEIRELGRRLAELGRALDDWATLAADQANQIVVEGERQQLQLGPAADSDDERP